MIGQHGARAAWVCDSLGIEVELSDSPERIPAPEKPPGSPPGREVGSPSDRCCPPGCAVERRIRGDDRTKIRL
jgi:hypothetical protein